MIIVQCLARVGNVIVTPVQCSLIDEKEKGHCLGCFKYVLCSPLLGDDQI